MRARGGPKKAAFIVRWTAITAPPMVPEIRLHLATEVTPLWKATETKLRRAGIPPSEPPYWAFAWVGGQALARRVLDEPTLVAGRRVLDFAAGSGLVAIAAAKAGAASVTAVDVDPLAHDAILLNAALNGVALEVLLAQAVLFLAIGVVRAGIDEEDVRGGALLVEHQDGGGDAGAEEELCGQADHSFQ